MCGEELYTENTHIQADTQGETGSSGEKQLNQGQSWKLMTTSQSCTNRPALTSYASSVKFCDHASTSLQQAQA